MATYAPPTASLTLFNPDVFLSSSTGDFLTFPVAQGSETFPFGLTTSSMTTTDPTTIDTLVMSDLNPQYKIDYPVNSGRIDFFTNTAGGVSTRGLKVDATGVHTVQKYDTIDEITGTLDIGANASRSGTINIGTGATNKNINVGASGFGTTTIAGGGNTNLQGTNINIGGNTTSGSINLGRTDATASSQTINIGNGSNQSGSINIGTGASVSKAITVGNVSGAFGTLNLGCASISIANASNTTALNLGTGMTSGAVILGGSGTSTLTVNRPIAPAYLPSAITANTQIGYTTSTTDNTFTQAVAGVYNILSVSLPSGVWMVEGCFVFSGATGGGRKISLGTTTAVSETDRANGVATGSFASLQVSTVFSFSTTTTVYLNIDITAALGASGLNFTTLRHTRLA